ncbi:hypothetical protein [Cyanobacterium sp. Dongsha4]|uniref:hypothetical protein n=1 Tax=Cyanobacterium sp. DS4 TaxID=2878255 RepID=UPI002E81DC9A|nr:hypothetical protein [Cyanobacterium sp. Dongsha4]WVL00438.1 hypothetical protein Dongsha4_17600 [Cyanobacterium sp. Dongsha4]
MVRDAYERVPLMFRSQIDSRCQIQRLVPKAKIQDGEIWADEWLDSVTDSQDYQFSSQVQTKSYQFTWRFITNSGQDDGVIRPVIGAKGFPYFPGSSMKGAFWRSCPKKKRPIYCGYEENGESHPGILRFHGGYPDKEWMSEELVDVVHPQEGWQIKGYDNHSAFIQISLYQPQFTFGISSNKTLNEEEWQEIWQIWEDAIAQGLGTRVSAGYGQVKLDNRDELNSIISVNLKGQGLASQLISKEGEFRVNMFKAALRGHTMRLLGGVTTAEIAEKLTKKLWGGFDGRNGAIVGELGIVFNPIDLEMNNFTYTPARNSFDMPIYKLEHGVLDILAMGKIKDKRKEHLHKFLTKILQFSLLLGGFGKSWRRIDHRLFYSDYLDNGNKPMIGCHWEFIKSSTKLFIPINELSDVTKFLDGVYRNMQNWVEKASKEELNANGANWRESFKKDNVQVWGRIAENRFESEAIYYFHDQDYGIKQSNLTGRMGRVGRIIHRMYPRRVKQEDKRILPTKQYVELLTIFPDNSDITNNFLNFLGSNASAFQRLW